jgi:hypothetical protein
MIKTAFCAVAALCAAGVYLAVVKPMQGAPASPAAPKAPAMPSLTDASFAQWRDFIRPKPEECKWQEIEWRSSLLEAAREANRLDKPVLLWAMNGHPLACT